MKTEFWDFSVNLWFLLAGGFLVALSLWFTIRQLSRSGRRPVMVLAEAIKTIVCLMLLVTLLAPEKVHSIRKEENPALAVLLDSSKSMMTADVLDPSEKVITRQQWVEKTLTNGLPESLESRFDTFLHRFSSVNTNSDSIHGTDINRALKEARERHENLRAALLISDGDWNKGRSPVSAATGYSVDDVRIFAVSVGSDRYLPDLEIQDVKAPAYCLAGESVTIPFTVQSRLPDDISTTVSLRSASGLLSQKKIIIPAMARIHETLIFNPEREAELSLSVTVPVQPEEYLEENNSRNFRISVRQETLRVLAVESLPRWEYRFIRNALIRDPGVEVDCLLFHSGTDIGPGAGPHYISSFPENKKELSVYDVVFIGDVGVKEGQLTSEQANMLNGLVKEQGSGIVFLPGPQGNELSLGGTSLEKLIPVKMDPSKPEGTGSPMPSRLLLTSRGKGHLLTMLNADPARDRAIWRSLPGFYWSAPVIKSSPGATVLGAHSSLRNKHGRIPLLVTRRAGNGKVLFMGMDGVWRWRRGVEDVYHYRFWGQVVRWMSHQRHIAHSQGMRFFYSPEDPTVGEDIFVSATVFDDSGFPVQGGRVIAKTRSQNNKSSARMLKASEEGWGVFEGSFKARQSGPMALTLTHDPTGRSVKTTIDVSHPRLEKAGRPARSETLREIAAITGGECVGIDKFADIVRELSLLPEPEAEERRMRLWGHPVWFLVITLGLTSYWIIRKLAGVV